MTNARVEIKPARVALPKESAQIEMILTLDHGGTSRHPSATARRLPVTADLLQFFDDVVVCWTNSGLAERSHRPSVGTLLWRFMALRSGDRPGKALL